MLKDISLDDFFSYQGSTDWLDPDSHSDRTVQEEKRFEKPLT